MKQILFLTLFMMELFGSTIKTPIISIDKENQTLQISIQKIDVGVSGFAVRMLDPNHSSILKNVEVIDFDADKKVATLKMMEFKTLRNNMLPAGRWELEVGDTVELAFAYNRALLIAPSEEIYHQITKSVKVQWIHPDLFATVLSFRGHPTPLKDDFEVMAIDSSVGLLFIYLERRVYTLDIHSFKILSISDAPLTQDSVMLPFYSRVEKIEANWFGEGSDELKEYEPHYYKLLAKYNKTNEKLYEIIKNSDVELRSILKKFELEEK